MEASLKFGIPDEKKEFDYAINGERYYQVLKELNDYLDNYIKSISNSPQIVKEYQYLKNRIDRLCMQNNISL